METSQTIGKISEALAKAQGQMKPAAFDSINPHFKSKYATLAAIMEVARPALSANELAIIQGTSVDLDPVRVNVTTILTHSSGEWIKETLSIKPVSDTPQAIGSALSYAKRYGLSALVGIVSEEEDDANAASARPAEKPKLAVVKKPTPATPPTTTVDTPQSATQAQPKVKPEVKPEIKKQAPVQNTRVVRIRQIFQLSASLGHTPDQMKAEIGNIMGLGHAIVESKEIPDNMLDTIIERFTTALNNIQKEKAA